MRSALIIAFRDIEDLLAELGIIVSYEIIRQWCEKFGLDYARKLKRREGRLGDHWYLDEVFIRINDQQRYLCKRLVNRLPSGFSPAAQGEEFRLG
jgi:transposase-like protein